MGAPGVPSYPWWNPYTFIMWFLFLAGVWLFIRYEKRKRSFPHELPLSCKIPLPRKIGIALSIFLGKSNL